MDIKYNMRKENLHNTFWVNFSYCGNITFDRAPLEYNRICPYKQEFETMFSKLEKSVAAKSYHTVILRRYIFSFFLILTTVGIVLILNDLHLKMFDIHGKDLYYVLATVLCKKYLKFKFYNCLIYISIYFN